MPLKKIVLDLETHPAFAKATADCLICLAKNDEVVGCRNLKYFVIKEIIYALTLLNVRKMENNTAYQN